MRPFRFRAWDKDKKIMLYDMCDPDIQKWAELYDLKLGEWLHPTVWKMGMLNGTLMQFTGLTDKNGKEIYESDIVEYFFSFTDKRRCISTIQFSQYDDDEQYSTWHHLGWNYEEGSLADKHNQMEVIGNIHQHPELINDKAK